MTGKSLALICAGAVIALFALAPEAIAADIHVDGALQRHVEQGRLDMEIRHEVSARGKSEVLIMLDDEPVDPISSSPQDRLQERLDRRARLLGEKKKSLLDRLSPTSFTQLTSYAHFPVMHLKVDGPALVSLLDRSEVVAVRYNRGLKPFLTESLPLVHAPQVHSQGFSGSGTSVAVLDTGVDYRLSAFGSCSSPGVPSGCKVVYAEDIAPSDNSLDDLGHGTNVAAIVLGVAPDTRIVALDVFRSDGYAYYSDLLAALDWIMTNRAAYNIVAVNMSFGGGSFYAPCPTDPLAGAIADLRSVGILSAIASGNDAYNGSMATPACVPGALSVGAVYDSNVGGMSTSVCSDLYTLGDMVTCFTNMASFLSILAPGAYITAGERTFAGTSQATPHIAGAVALLKASHPALTADAITDRLITSGTPITTTRNSTTYIKPRLNLEDALSFPQISAVPVSADFGTVTAGRTSTTSPIVVTNSGSAPLNIGSVSLSGANPSDFIVAMDGCSNVTLPAGSSCTVSVAFRPLSAGTKNSSLLLPSNDPDWPNRSIPLSGLCNSFLITVSRSGNGSVGSSPTFIDCGSTCTAGIPVGTSLSLNAAAGADSLFSGWGGACAGTGTCSVIMTANIEVSALFTLKPPVMLQSLVPVYYQTITSVYAAALDGAVIELQAVSFPEDLLLNRDISITLLGGYDPSYSAVSGTYTIRSLTISSGSASIAGITIQ